MRAKTVNFQRGQNPKAALDIGLIKSITSDDLALLEFGWIYDEQRFDEEEFIKEYNFVGDSDEEKREALERAKSLAKILEGQIIMFLPFFDWKEEDKLHAFIKTNPFPDYPYIYDSAPSMDEWRLIFSKIELPNADEIKY
jgi:hypothetical protein